MLLDGDPAGTTPRIKYGREFGGFLRKVERPIMIASSAMDGVSIHYAFQVRPH